MLACSTPSAAKASRQWKVPSVDPRFYRPAPEAFKDRGCLRLLRALKVPFTPLKSVKGVATPIRVQGNAIGRTRYIPRYSSNKMVMDCRMALALFRAGEIFKANEVSGVVFSNFYSYRSVEATGRLSRHALGLAIDIHGFVDDKGARLDVTADYEKGLGKGKTCEGRAKTYKGRVLRDLACDLDASGLFESVLTPDYDAGHANHYHVSVFHPQDRLRHRLFRTVLMEVRGTMYPWTWSRPPRATYSAARINAVVKNRWRGRRTWHRWQQKKTR
jgi:hypothetical protein